MKMMLGRSGVAGCTRSGVSAVCFGSGRPAACVCGASSAPAANNKSLVGFIGCFRFVGRYEILGPDRNFVTKIQNYRITSPKAAGQSSDADKKQASCNAATRLLFRVVPPENSPYNESDCASIIYNQNFLSQPHARPAKKSLFFTSLRNVNFTMQDMIFS